MCAAYRRRWSRAKSWRPKWKPRTSGIVRWAKPRRLSAIKRRFSACDICSATKSPTWRCTWESWLEVRTLWSAQQSKLNTQRACKMGQTWIYVRNHRALNQFTRNNFEWNADLIPEKTREYIIRLNTLSKHWHDFWGFWCEYFATSGDVGKRDVNCRQFIMFEVSVEGTCVAWAIDELFSVEMPGWEFQMLFEIFLYLWKRTERTEMQSLICRRF